MKNKKISKQVKKVNENKIINWSKETKIINQETKDFEINITFPFLLFCLLFIIVWINDFAGFIEYSTKAIKLNGVILNLVLIPLIFLFVKDKLCFEKLEFNIYNLLITVFIVVLTLLRLPLPDTGFDTINYHIFLQQFGFIDNINKNFFPSGFWTFSFPLGDRVFYIFRALLGYRAGTSLNTLVILLIYFQIENIVRTYSNSYRITISSFTISILSFLILSTEYIILNISTYMVDLLFIPFALELLRVILFQKKYNKWLSFYVAFLMGISMALKLTNIIYVFVLLVVYIIKFKDEINIRIFIISVFISIVPVSIYLLYNSMSTNNALFPYYNSFFKSPYYLISNFKDIRWNPHSIFQYLSWPVYIFFVPKRCSELAVYSGRLSLGFFILVVYFIHYPFCNKLQEKRNYIIVAITIISLILWEITTGYIRYALFLEIIVGIFTILISSEFIVVAKVYYKMLGYIFIILLIAQSSFGYYLILIKDMDWGNRSSIIRDYGSYLDNVKMIGSDTIGLKDNNLLKSVDVWAISGYDSGYATMLKNDIPIFDINLLLIKETNAAREAYKNALNRYKLKHIFTIATHNDFEKSIEILNSHGFKAVNIDTVQPSFLQKNQKLYLLETIKSTEQNVYRNLNEKNPIITLEIPNNGNFSLSSFVGFHPITYNWASDGCRLLIDVSDGTKTVNIINQYISPNDNFKKISVNINGEEFSSQKLNIVFHFANDPGKNGNGDWLSIVNPTVQAVGGE